MTYENNLTKSVKKIGWQEVSEDEEPYFINVLAYNEALGLIAWS